MARMGVAVGQTWTRQWCARGRGSAAHMDAAVARMDAKVADIYVVMPDITRAICTTLSATTPTGAAGGA